VLHGVRILGQRPRFLMLRLKVDPLGFSDERCEKSRGENGGMTIDSTTELTNYSFQKP